MAVNIPESGEGEERSFTSFDDLSKLKGKKVLIVEDDVRTGATLQKLVEALGTNKPAQMSLYLGQPERFQLQANIPPEFSKTYIAGAGVKEEELGKEFTTYLESRGLRVFKNKE